MNWLRSMGMGLLLTGFLGLSARGALACDLKVAFSSIELDRGGEICAAMFPATLAASFPTFDAKVQRLCVPANKGAAVTFTNIVAGSYAIAVLHDENRDGQLNTNFIGMPKEGVGASNNAKGRLGPPSFEEAQFSIGELGCKPLDIALAYLL